MPHVIPQGMLPYISVAEAINLEGLRLVLPVGVPGPWAMAARAVFDIKGIDYIPVAQKRVARDEQLRRWSGQESSPAAMYQDERPRTRWDEIIYLAERLAPTPRLVPEDESERADMMGLLHELCSEEGLMWNVRTYSMEEQRKRSADDPRNLAHTDESMQLLWYRYGDSSRGSEDATERIVAVLKLLANALHASQSRGSEYLIGNKLTALDLYWTAFSNAVAPFAHDIAPMPEYYRAFCEWNRKRLGNALDPELIAHRDRVLSRHFRLPLRF